MLKPRAFKEAITWVYDGTRWHIWFYEDKTLWRLEGPRPGVGKRIREKIGCSFEEAEATAWRMRRKYLRNWCCDYGPRWQINQKANFERVIKLVIRP